MSINLIYWCVYLCTCLDSLLARKFVSFLILCMHLYILFCILTSCYIHTTLTRPPSTSSSSASGMPGAGGNSSESNEGGKRFIGGASVTAFLLERCSFLGSWKLGHWMKQKMEISLSFDEILSVIYIDVYIDTLDGDGIIPHDARQRILRAFFIWRSMMNFH